MTPGSLLGRIRAARPEPHRGAPQRVVVRDTAIERSDGSLCALVESGDLDVRSLDPGRRGAVLAAFARLCRTLDAHLELLVQVRRWECEADVAGSGAAGSAGTVADRLRRAGDAHERHMLQARPAYRRSILFIPSVGSARDAGDRLDRAVATVLETANVAGVGGRRLGLAAVAERLAESWGGVAAIDEPEDGARTLAPPDWEATPTHLRSGRLLLRGRALQRFPGLRVEPGWLAPMLDVRAECDVALHLEPIEVRAALSRLSRRLRALRSDQLVSIDRDTVGDAMVDAGIDSALDLRTRLARNEGRAVALSLTAVARARDLATLDDGSDALADAFAATLAASEPTHLEHRAAALTCWPLGADVLARTKLVDTTSAATCLPWTDATCRDGSGYRLGRATRTGAPVQLAPFDTGHHPNANIAIFAASGQGKSYAIGAIVLEALSRGVGSVIVDPEGEYEPLMRQLGGEVLSLAPGCRASLNVFDAGSPDDGSATGESEAAGAVVDLVNVLCGESLDDVERSHVDAAAQAAIRLAASQGRTALLGDCIDSLESVAPRVAVVLRRFCSGQLGELFNRPTSVRLSGDLVSISMRDLRSELVPAATFIVAEWLWSLVRSQQRERHLVVDEVGLLCAHDALRTLLVQLARRCRKYRTSLVIATQNAGDLLATDQGTVVATNPSILLLGGHRGAETARMQAAFGLTESQRRALDSAGRGEFLLLAGPRRVPMHVEMPPLHHALLTGMPAPM